MVCRQINDSWLIDSIRLKNRCCFLIESYLNIPERKRMINSVKSHVLLHRLDDSNAILMEKPARGCTFIGNVRQESAEHTYLTSGSSREVGVLASVNFCSSTYMRNILLRSAYLIQNRTLSTSTGLINQMTTLWANFPHWNIWKRLFYFERNDTKQGDLIYCLYVCFRAVNTEWNFDETCQNRRSLSSRSGQDLEFVAHSG